MKYDWNKEKLEQVIPESDSLSDVLNKLQIPIQGNNSRTLKSKIEEYGIDISHFTYSAKKRKGRIIFQYLNIYLMEVLFKLLNLKSNF